jgi:hypothetical protein
MATTVVGPMTDIKEAQELVRDLVDNGFSREAISITSSLGVGEEQGSGEQEGDTSEPGFDAVKGTGAGVLVGGIGGLVVGLTGMALSGIGPVTAAGPFASMLVGALIGGVAGAIVGTISKSVPEEHLHYSATGCAGRGEVLVTVSTEDDSADRAAEIMRSHGVVEVEKRRGGS